MHPGDFAESLLAETKLSAHDLESLNRRLGEAITADYQGKFPLLIGVLNGCVPFIGDLMRHINLPLSLHFVHTSAYGYAQTPDAGALCVQKAGNFDLRGRHVLLVDEILDAGITFERLCDWAGHEGAASVKTVTMVERAGVNRRFLHADYTGIAIADSRWFVGYGCDVSGTLRNLPFMAVVPAGISVESLKLN